MKLGKFQVVPEPIKFLFRFIDSYCLFNLDGLVHANASVMLPWDFAA